MLHPNRLEEILALLPQKRILVVGDFFLDKYLMLDRRLSEISLETGLEAYQVTEKRVSPGAAGTVVNNLRALGVEVTALSVIGADGEGYELKRALSAQKVDIDHLLEAPNRFTPTYTKAMMRESDGRTRELNRFDIKNRSPQPDDLQQEIISRLQALAANVDGIIVADQVPEPDCGVITGRVRQAIIALGSQTSGPLITVDSRERIGLFKHVILKPNAAEALKALGAEQAGEQPSLAAAQAAGEVLSRRSGKPVFVTLGERGMLLVSGDGAEIAPALPVDGPVDIVGAGDSVIAALTAGLCCGATPLEAACLGNLAAFVTIQQLGTTGIVSPEQLRWANKGERQPYLIAE
ncbi:MAG TPA: carbohydrate kinase [Chloroflexi bacterium]|nr:MAG: hypothetical protein B6243_13635 [Anaerolineaceae bacterium 4572_5.2]HEY84428.1 carbohydrate kinase [Chloroflexota bacterium]